jgi:hypothetical protein
MSWQEAATFIEIINDYIRYVLDQAGLLVSLLC